MWREETRGSYLLHAHYPNNRVPYKKNKIYYFANVFFFIVILFFIFVFRNEVAA